MPKPATTHELVSLLRRSRLVDEAQLAVCARTADRSSPGGMLTQLIDDGLLTQFQAEHLAAGRWRGLVVGEYRLREKLGSGGMGTVFLAEHRTGREKVAIKVLSAQMASDPVARERFLREAKAAATLTHPNIVHVIDVDPDADPPYLVLEYIDGVSLQAAVALRGTFAAGSAAHCGRQIALALQRAHEVGLVHRDIKPANLLVDRTGLVKVLDLGIVRMDLGGDLTFGSGQKFVLGTADYLAPEQAVNSHAVDSRADLYSLGATLYFLLAGHPPFPEGSPQEKVMRKQAVDPPRIERFRPDLPAGYADVIHRLLARRPDDRYPIPLRAAEALEPFATPEPRFPSQLFDAPAARIAAAGDTPRELPHPCLAAGAATMVLPGHGTHPSMPALPPDPEPGPATATVDVRVVRSHDDHSALWFALGVGLLALAAAALAAYLWLGGRLSAGPVAPSRAGGSPTATR